MFGFIFGLIIGGFLGMLGTMLCVICRGSAEADLLDACERALKFGLNPSLERIVKAAIAKANKEGGE